MCAYADNFAVPACSFRDILPHIEVACRTIDDVTGMNLHHRKCVAGCNTDFSHAQRSATGVAASGPDCRDMKMAQNCHTWGL